MLNLNIEISGVIYQVNCLYIAPIPTDPLELNEREPESLFIKSVKSVFDNKEIEIQSRYYKRKIKRLCLDQIHKIIGN